MKLLKTIPTRGCLAIRVVEWTGEASQSRSYCTLFVGLSKHRPAEDLNVY